MSYGNLHLPTSEAEDTIRDYDIAPARSNTVTNDRTKDDQRHIPPTSALDQTSETLLRALRNVIIPLAQSAGVAVRNDEVSDGPEGEEFLTALQKYITYIVQPQSHHQAGITIHLEDSPLDTSPTEATTVCSQSEPGFNLKDHSEFCNTGISPAMTTEEDNSMIITGSNVEVLDHPEHPPQLTVLEKICEELRHRIFNTMPIRMLSFDTHGSQLTIALVERAVYFAHILSEVKAGFNEAQFLVQLKEWKEQTCDPSTDVERRLIRHLVRKLTRYAILSHTWLPGPTGEVTYGKWQKGDFDANQPGYQKLINFCRVAAVNHGITLGWMDTVCINKESSAELDESIRSMYKWYKEAYVCITYLAETVDLVNMHKDPWFSRGWTLQELLAPRYTKFYGRYWKQVVKTLSNDKRNCNIQHEIKLATTITDLELNYLNFTSMFRMLQWAAMREVTREEDAAYSLMGIFDVGLSIAYGEGAQQAFFRLLKEVLLSSTRDDVMEIFYWAGNYTGKMSSLLPSSPKAYLHNGPDCSEDLFLNMPMKPLLLTHRGLRIPVLVMPAGTSYGSPYVPFGDYYATVTVDISPSTGDGDNHVVYNVLDRNVSDAPDNLGYFPDDRGKIAFGVLNFGGDENTIDIQKMCFAVALKYTEDEGGRVLGSAYKMETKAPVVFDLRRLEPDSVHAALDGQNSSYIIPKNQLGYHGIQLLNLYL